VEVSVERNSIDRAFEYISQQPLAVLQRRPFKVFTVEFDQVECAEDGSIIVVMIAQEIEDGEPIRVYDDGLTVD
jgi:hypothetical protein